jgi:ketosteroid isomerase-like protein
MSPSTTNIAFLHRYLSAVERGVTGAELAEFLTPDVVQEEFPNPIVPKGVRRNLQALLAAAERGQQVIASQQFEVLNSVSDGDRMAVELLWSGTLAVPVGTLAAGSTMQAHIGMFMELRNGKIASQRNYDCYEPW